MASNNTDDIGGMGIEKSRTQDAVGANMTYTFDVFDTLITRTTADPTGIFSLMQRKLENTERYSDICGHIIRHFNQFRIDAEQEARRTQSKRNAEEITIEEIYALLSYMTGLTEYTAARLMELELETELKSSVPIRENIEKLKRCMASGSVYLISDMYLPEQYIRKLLLQSDDIFSDIPLLVSCDVGKTKRTGSLYQHFLNEFQIDASRWIHMGDDPVSDGSRVEQCGGKSKLYTPTRISAFEERLKNAYGSNAEFQLSLGAVKNIRADGDSESRAMGKCVGGPILCGYVLWILQESVEKGIRELYFIARDGYILKQIADLILSIRNMPVNAHYLYGSRLAWRLPAVCTDRASLAEWLEEICDFESLDELAAMLHLKRADIEPFLPKLYCVEEHRFTKGERFAIKNVILGSAPLLNCIFERGSRLLKDVQSYLLQEITLSDEKLAFVDLSGTGYTQQCLKRILNGYYDKPLISFFYSMTDISQLSDGGNVYYKYIYKRFLCCDVAEVLARAPHGQTTGYYYSEEEQKWCPQLEEGNDYTVGEPYRDYLAGVLEYTRAMCAQDCCTGSGLAVVSEEFVTHICTEPEDYVKRYIGEMPFSSGSRHRGKTVYAPALTNRELRKMFLYHGGCSLERDFRGVNYEFSMSRLTKQQKRRVKAYKKLYSLCFHKLSAGAKSGAMDIRGNIVVYGAGKLGKKVYRSMRGKKGVRVVLWADRNYQVYAQEGLSVAAPEKIPETSFDYVVISIANPKLFGSISKDLIQLGVPQEKIIVWSGRQ